MASITNLLLSEGNNGDSSDKGSQLYNHERAPSKRVKKELAQLLLPDQKLTHQQINALGWLIQREDCPPDGVRGGLILDVPGLGKTTQMLALIALQSWRRRSVATSTPALPATLVLCPSRVICEVWTSELRKRFQAHILTPCIFHGPSREALLLQQQQQQQQLETNAASLICLTTYATLVQEAKKAATSPLFTTSFHRIVLDEAHLVRNAKTKIGKSIVDLKATIRWAMTATPIHNHVQDLYNLVKFLRIPPYAENAKLWQSEIVELAHQDRHAALRRLHALLSGIALRRSAESLKLPEISYIEVVLEQRSELEKQFYAALQRYCALRGREFLARRDEVATCQPTSKRGVSTCLLTLITYLREACCHPWLAVASMRRFKSKLHSLDLATVTERLEQLCQQDQRRAECRWCLDMEADGLHHASYTCLHRFCKDCERVDGSCKLCSPSSASRFAKKTTRKKEKQREADQEWRQLCETHQGSFTLNSAKLHHIIQEVARYCQEEKIIIVSQWVRLLQLVEIELHHVLQYTSTEVNASSPFLIHLRGDTCTTKRSQLIEDFQNDPAIRLCLLSLNCSSEGITLTSASRMYILDPWWNPAKDYQAMHRLYRLGQDKPVQICALYVEATVEDRIRCMRAAKGAVAMATVAEAAPPEELNWIDQARLFFEPPKPKGASSISIINPPECFLPGKVKASIKYGADYDKEVDLERQAFVTHAKNKNKNNDGKKKSIPIRRLPSLAEKERVNGLKRERLKNKSKWGARWRKPRYYSNSPEMIHIDGLNFDNVLNMMQEHPMFDVVLSQRH